MAFIGSAATPAEFSKLQNGIQVEGDDIIDGSGNTIYDQASNHIPVSILQYSSLSVNAGNGLQNGGTVVLNGSTTLDIKTSDIVGSYLSQTADVISVNIGDGLVGSNDNITVDESYGFNFTQTIEFSTGLNSSGDISGGTTTIWDSSNGYVPTSTLESDVVSVSTGTGLTGGGDFSLGGSGLTLNVDETTSFSFTSEIDFGAGLNIGNNQDFQFFRDNSTDELVLRDNNGVELFRQAKSGVINFLQGIDAGPISAAEDSFSQLINAPVTSVLGAGDRVGYSFSLDNQSIISIDGEADGSGGIQNTSIDVSREIVDSGTVIWDSVNSYIPISSLEFSNVTVTGSNGLSGGSTSLGGSIDVSISGNLSLDSDLISAGGQTIWSESANEIPDSALGSIDNTTLTNSSVTVAGNTVSLGGSISISLANLSSYDISGNNLTDSGSTIWDSASGEIPDSAMGSIDNGTLTNSSITISSGNGLTGGSTPSLGGSMTIGIATGGVDVNELNTPFATLNTLFGSPVSVGAQLNLDADLLGSDGSSTIWDSTNNYIPISSLQFTDVTVSGSNGLSGGTTSLGGTVTVGISGNLSLDSDLVSTGGLTIWDDSAGYIPQGRLQNDSVTYNAGNGIASAGTVSLGSTGTISVDASTFITSDSSGVSVNIGRGLENDGSNNIRLNESTSFTFTSDISFTSAINVDDEVKQFFGSNNDFSQRFDNVTGDWVLRDEDTGVDLIRQPKAGPTQFIQGADIGSIESPEDSFTQIVNASVTSALSSGDTVGYTFAVDNQSIFNVTADADGSGGITNQSLNIQHDLNDSSNNLIWDSSNSYIPQGRLQNDSVTVSSGTNITGGGSVALGSSTTISLGDPVNVSTLNANDIGDNGQGFIDFNVSGTKRAELDSSGNIDIEGELTEGAAL